MLPAWPGGIAFELTQSHFVFARENQFTNDCFALNNIFLQYLQRKKKRLRWKETPIVSECVLCKKFDSFADRIKRKKNKTEIETRKQ